MMEARESRLPLLEELPALQRKPGMTLTVFTDYENLCAPHVPAIREVLEGQRHRYKLRFGNATLVFHHGCLMIQVVHDGLIRSLPPFGIDADGQPYLQAMPEHQKHWITEFLGLPKSLLLFYFSLLKQVFRTEPLQGRWENPETGRVSMMPVPEELRPILAEVDWPVR